MILCMIASTYYNIIIGYCECECIRIIIASTKCNSLRRAYISEC